MKYAKLLGVTISSDLTWNKHVENIVAKAGKRVDMLYQLKRAGIGQHDLVTIYISVIRPVLEYACPVWPVADRGVSGPWGPQFYGGPCNGETQRLPGGGAGRPQVGSEAKPRRQTHFGNNILKIG